MQEGDYMQLTIDGGDYLLRIVDTPKTDREQEEELERVARNIGNPI